MIMICIVTWSVVCQHRECHKSIPLILKHPLQMVPPVNRGELTIIIPDDDVGLIKSWSDCYTWLATRIGKGDLELLISLHNEIIYHCNIELDTSLPSRDGHFLGESSSREINTSCERNGKQPIQ